jgi:hypothetical protein
LLGGVERSQRIQEFMDRAREARAAETDSDPAEEFENDDLDDLF